MNTPVSKPAGGVVGGAAGAAPAEDKSQDIKAAGVSAEAAVASAQGTTDNSGERPPLAAGPKASDIPASSIVGADGQSLAAQQANGPTDILAADGKGPGPVVSSVNEYSVSQSDLVRILAMHYGFDANVGVTEILPHPNGVGSGLVVKYSK